MKLKTSLCACFFVLSLTCYMLGQAGQTQKNWTFAASGDSRNCGDVVMPSIAQGAQAGNAQLYLHLGDFRALYDFDEDMIAVPGRNGAPRKWAIQDYVNGAWPDFIQHQVHPFSTVPVFLAMGNHELYSGKTRGDYIAQFADWINAPDIQHQRFADDPNDHMVKTYSHWIQGGVDFIVLDNASRDQFDPAQVKWLEGVLKRAESNSQVRSVVVGMHAALPDSLASSHSMNDWPQGEQSGRQVYTDLLKFKDATKKNVYILASHSHFYMEGIYDSDYWRAHGGILPGWIIGTAGAVRYRLPEGAAKARAAKTDIYGYLLATVHPDGMIDFKFNQVDEKDVPPSIVQRYGADTVHKCYTENKQ